MPGPRPRSTLLKLIRGTSQPCRLRDDKPKIEAPPALPPGVTLTFEEQQMFDWLLSHVYMRGVHGTADGPAFIRIARLWARANQADAKVEQFGMVMRNARTSKPELQPYARLSRDLWHQLGIALADIGATPAGRLKVAGPRGTISTTIDADWDSIE